MAIVTPFYNHIKKNQYHNAKLISLLRIITVITVIYFYVFLKYTLWHACNFDMATDKQGQFWQFDLPQFAKLATLLFPWKSETNFALMSLLFAQRTLVQILLVFSALRKSDCDSWVKSKTLTILKTSILERWNWPKRQFCQIA